MYDLVEQAIGYVSDLLGDLVKCLRKKKIKRRRTKKHQHLGPQCNEHLFQNNNIYQNPYQVNQLYQVSDPTFTCQSPSQISMRYHPQNCPFVQ
jgi:hypothetical protein